MACPRILSSLSLHRLFLAALSMGVAPPAAALCLSPVCSCSVTTTNVAFPPFNPLSGSIGEGVGNIRVACAGVGIVIPYTIALSKGFSNTYAMRTMKFGSNTLNYNLFLDPTYLQLWGDGTGGSLTASGSISINALGIGPVNDHPIYGRIPNGQSSVVPSNGYSENITVTLTYQ